MKPMTKSPTPPSPPKPKPRCGRLNTVGRVRRELVRLYKEARAGTLDVNDASRLANILFLAARLLEGAELEARIAKLEADRDPRVKPLKAVS